jgi:asparaginyl-tRNA synthetase
MLKNLFIKDLFRKEAGICVDLYCFVKSIRNHGGIIFLDLIDSSGQIQAVIDTDILIQAVQKLTPESCINVQGLLVHNTDNDFEIKVQDIKILNLSQTSLTPSPRENFDIFNDQLANHLFNKRHLYLRNPKFISIQKFRNFLLYYIREWFYINNFIEIATPVITPVVLYEDSSAIQLKLNNQQLFLSQCAGYYLEAACVAHEKVYNISPSFRGKESRSKRHLMEYWHIKAEIAFGNLEDIISVIENLFSYLIIKIQKEPLINEILTELNTSINVDSFTVPWQKITYEEAISILHRHQVQIEFGTSISTSEEKLLSEILGGAFWLCYNPRKIEPFPYKINNENKDLTQVADLIANNGFGEILGVAEKIYQSDELEQRLAEKNLLNDKRYRWIREVHETGCPPHIAFGMGVERLLRWFLNIPHVRDVHPFPRVFGRKIKI